MSYLNPIWRYAYWQIFNISLFDMEPLKQNKDIPWVEPLAISVDFSRSFDCYTTILAQKVVLREHFIANGSAVIFHKRCIESRSSCFFLFGDLEIIFKKIRTLINIYIYMKISKLWFFFLKIWTIFDKMNRTWKHEIF